jgi:hypothetical protein
LIIRLKKLLLQKEERKNEGDKQDKTIFLRKYKMELIKQIDETVSFNENNIRVIGSYKEPWFVANILLKQ